MKCSHELMCLNTCFPASDAVLGGCASFERWTITDYIPLEL